jgi:protein gp37
LPIQFWNEKTFVYDSRINLRIVGGETGSSFRLGAESKTTLDEWYYWAFAVKKICDDSTTSFFFKKPPGRTHTMDTDGFTVDTPKDLRVREFPEYEHLLTMREVEK